VPGAPCQRQAGGGAGSAPAVFRNHPRALPEHDPGGPQLLYFAAAGERHRGSQQPHAFRLAVRLAKSDPQWRSFGQAGDRFVESGNRPEHVPAGDGIGFPTFRPERAEIAGRRFPPSPRRRWPGTGARMRRHSHQGSDGRGVSQAVEPQQRVGPAPDCWDRWWRPRARRAPPRCHAQTPRRSSPARAHRAPRRPRSPVARFGWCARSAARFGAQPRVRLPQALYEDGQYPAAIATVPITSRILSATAVPMGWPSGVWEFPIRLASLTSSSGSFLITRRAMATSSSRLHRAGLQKGSRSASSALQEAQRRFRQALPSATAERPGRRRWSRDSAGRAGLRASAEGACRKAATSPPMRSARVCTVTRNRH